MKAFALAWPAVVFGLTVAAAQSPLVGTAQAPSTSAVGTPQASSAGTRVGIALVIGNSKYEQGELPTVDTDKRTMAAALRSLGFVVHETENLPSPRAFEEEFSTFIKKEDLTSDDLLVVYYSGHGLQIEGRPFLLGTGMKGAGDTTASLRDSSIDVDRIVRMMEQSAASARVLIIDACRNNAFTAVTRKAGPSFDRYTQDTYLLFADEPGKTVPARSETSVQSPFTAALLYAFENSDKGLEDRFEIASRKTRELNPDQNPQILKSDSSPNRNRPFLDHDGRSVAAGSAVHLLEEAEEFYLSRSWDSFRNKISAARILSAEPELSARLDKELAFCDAVQAAVTAEADPAGTRWVEAAQAWGKAGALFPARVWVQEKSAVAWLMADRLPESAAALGRMRKGPLAERAALMLAPLLKLDAELDAVARSAADGTPAVDGPEFEKYVRKQQ